jgi:hypothetical protein
MPNFAESNVLLRERIDLPQGFKVAAGEFRDGWTVMRTGGARRLERKTRACGWNFVSMGDAALRSGVGDTSQMAIASALRLALRRVEAYANAVELERIELTHYPWFILARVHVKSYRIQEGLALPALDESQLPPMTAQRRLPPQAAELFPGFGNAMPMLKEMLVASRASEARAS